MSKSDPNLEIGAIVYRPYAPTQYGKVIALYEDQQGRRHYGIRWKDGSESQEWYLHVNSFADLIADHEKKLATHRANLKKAEQL